MLFLKFILNDGSVENAFETVEELEFAHDGIVIVKALSDNWGKSPLKFFNFCSKDKEVLIKLFLINIHSVIREGSKVLNSFFEFFWDLFQSFCESSSFGSS